MPVGVSILVCRCECADLVPRDVPDEVLRRLDDAGAAYETTPELCSLCEQQDGALERLAASSDLRIAACFPRAVRWLFAAAGATLPQRVRLLNLRTQSAGEIAGALLAGAVPGERAEIPAPAAGEQTPWFPVIDYDRCADCGQCLNFCLFGVYGASDDGRISVEHPLNCKLNCPACARVCPQTAIVFPKYAKGGPIAGDDVLDDAEAGGANKVDLDSLMKGDVYAALRSRGEARRNGGESVLISPRLQKLLDIPPEVVEDLTGGRNPTAGNQSNE